VSSPEGRPTGPGSAVGDGERDWLGDAGPETAGAPDRDLPRAGSRGDDPDPQGPIGTTAAEGAAHAGVSTDVLLSARGLEVHFPIRRGIVIERIVGQVRAIGWPAGLGGGKASIALAVASSIRGAWPSRPP